MAPPTSLQILLALILLPTLFYLAGPFSASPTPPAYHVATADARLARFLDAVTPNGGYSRHGIELGVHGDGGEKPGSGGKKIVLWPLGEESKVMGRPGVRGGSWRSSPDMVSEHEDATKVGTKAETEAGGTG